MILLNGVEPHNSQNRVLAAQRLTDGARKCNCERSLTLVKVHLILL